MTGIANDRNEPRQSALLLISLSTLAGVVFAIATYGWMVNGTSIYLTMIQNGIAWCL